MRKIVNSLFVALLLSVAYTGKLCAQEGHWSYDEFAYQYDMAVYATVAVDEMPVQNMADYEVAAFCGDECRGIGVLQTAEKEGQSVSYFYLRIRSNSQEGEAITFKVYYKTADCEYNVNVPTMAFKSQDVIGLPSNPYKLNLPTVTLDEQSQDAPAASDGVVDVTVKRTINANSWSSICLPFSMDENQVKTAFGNDVKLGDFKGYDLLDEGKTIQVKFDAATAIAANHPYIIKVSKPIEEFTVNGVTIIATEKPMTDYGSEGQPKAMIGNYVNGTTLAEGDVFISGGKFWFSAGKTTIQGFRAFFSFYDLTPDSDETRFVLMFNDQPTSISMTRKQGDSKTVGYTISGIRSNMDKKGLYLVNGKKIIKK